MHRNQAVWALSVCLVLPVLWLAWATCFDGSHTVLLVAGALASAIVMLILAWRAHHAGLLLANRCATCDHPMCYTRPGEVTPPSGSAVTKDRFWRCRHCGRLV